MKEQSSVQSPQTQTFLDSTCYCVGKLIQFFKNISWNISDMPKRMNNITNTSELTIQYKTLNMYRPLPMPSPDNCHCELDIIPMFSLLFTMVLFYMVFKLHINCIYIKCIHLQCPFFSLVYNHEIHLHGYIHIKNLHDTYFLLI